ncbi:MAG: hypothetical protein D6725_10760 [Planctomycetota bacterium]|nr:MAG: hypothetical protein D6725_10760 [Planctomycetota bacterium]
MPSALPLRRKETDRARPHGPKSPTGRPPSNPPATGHEPSTVRPTRLRACNSADPSKRHHETTPSSDMSDSRDTILKRLRQLSLPPRDLPPLDGPWTAYAQPMDTFREQLQAVGGNVLEADSPEAARARIAELIDQLGASNVFSELPDLWPGNVTLRPDDDPHTLGPLDLAIACGDFAVAENAAVWVTDRRIPHRVVLFWAEHLVLLVPTGAIVSNMYQAYQRIELQPGTWGAFISGPSKTADIEQSLVIGAQGPRSLTVIFGPFAD